MLLGSEFMLSFNSASRSLQFCTMAYTAEILTMFFLIHILLWQKLMILFSIDFSVGYFLN